MTDGKQTLDDIRCVIEGHRWIEWGTYPPRLDGSIRRTLKFAYYKCHFCGVKKDEDGNIHE